jgi:tRNA-2-methylthio-N6-dimethylallyladenosine synthase
MVDMAHDRDHRRTRLERILGILDRVRERMPDAAITTDIIVGFPGETDEDFAETLRVVEQARFASAFTFQYSIREGTPAATMPDQVPKAVVQERYERLVALQERISLEENQRQVGRELQVLVSTGEGKKDAATRRLTGRAEDNRLVHFELPDGSAVPRPGDMVSVIVTRAAPFHLLADSADGAPLRIRRTRAGDAWDRAQAESCGVPAPSGGTSAPRAVSLGLPALRPSGA